MAKLSTREIVSRAIHRISLRFRPELPPEQPLPPPSPPPSPPPPPGGGGGPPKISHDQQMQRIYQRWNGRSLTGYLDWRDLFEPLEVIFDGDSEKEQYWDMFLRAFKLSTHDRGYIRRETFYNRTGIPRSQIDWSLWRDIMGYSGNR
jgi:hypothetical protein